MQLKIWIIEEKRLPFPLPLVGRGAGWGSTHLGRFASINSANAPRMAMV
jgi:hypothetical protein